MKSFLFAVALTALVAGQSLAQQCGSSCGTNQCGLNNRPRAAEPAAVPQAAPASLQSVAATEEWKAPEPFKVASYDRISGDAGSDRIEAQPVRGLNLFGVQVNREAQDNSNVEAFLAQQQAALDRIQNQVTDLRAQGQPVDMRDVREAIAAALPPMNPDDQFRAMRSSPEFQTFVRELLATREEKEIVTWEVVPVE